MMGASGAALVIAASACGRRSPPAPAATAPPAVDAGAPVATAASEDAAAAMPEPAWGEAVRLERWDDAARALDALAEIERARPEVRYVRARVALAKGDAARALELLRDLEPALPLLADDVARARAEAQREIGPFDTAGEYFAAIRTPAAQLKAADAFEKGKDLVRAKAACDRVIAHDKRTRAQEAEARARRLRLFGSADDARWLATRAPDLACAEAADAMFAREGAIAPLTQEEQVARARALADAGKLDAALAALDRALKAKAGGKSAKPLGPQERLRTKGDLFFRARARFPEAARAFTDAAALGGPQAGEDALRAGRALSRADKDDEAIAAYRDVARRFPGTGWAQQAEFLVAYLELLHGRFRDAARALDDHARRYPGKPFRGDAARMRAVAHLMAGDAKVARKAFEELAEDARSDDLLRGRMLVLAALAALRDGDRTHAVARWTEVAKGTPLTWPALVARARLAEVGAPVPPAMEAPEPAPEPAPLDLGLPPPADLLHRVGLDGDAEIALRAREAALVAAAPGRAGEALCGAYGLLGRAKRRFQIAQRDVPSAALRVLPGPRTRWAWECAFPRPYLEHVRAAEAREGLPPGLVHAVMRQESWFDPEVVSPARAVGLLQLMPDTADKVAEAMRVPHEEDWLTSPPHNIALGARFLRDLVERFEARLPLAVAGYNAGPEVVAKWSRWGPKDESLDLFVERIGYAETRGYVVRVMGNLARYAFLEGGETAVPRLALAPGPK